MLTTPPEGFTTRPATLDDAEAAVELVNACSIELIGKPEFEAHQFRRDWNSPYLNPETDLWLVFTEDDKLAGYAGVWDAEPYVQLSGWGNVHPDYKGQGIGTYLAGWVEERARESVPKAPEGARVVLMQSRLGIDKAAQELLHQQGYRVVRYAFRMLIEMDAPPPEAEFPDGITLQTFKRKEHLRSLVIADQEIFKDHWGFVESPLDEAYEYWEHLVEKSSDHDPSLWFLAMDGDEIAGISLCRFQTAEDPEESYVAALGVRRPWRRRGLALALLHHSFAELFRRGKRKVALHVDAQNLTGATRLYEKAGMHVQLQTVNYEKELRPGVDLRTESLE
jgi:mycothiol synthase